jgi:hypothetical protein
MLCRHRQRGKPSPDECYAKHLVPVPNSVGEEQADDAYESRDAKKLESFACPLIHGVRSGHNIIVMPQCMHGSMHSRNF